MPDYMQLFIIVWTVLFYIELCSVSASLQKILRESKIK